MHKAARGVVGMFGIFAFQKSVFSISKVELGYALVARYGSQIQYRVWIFAVRFLRLGFVRSEKW